SGGVRPDGRSRAARGHRALLARPISLLEASSDPPLRPSGRPGSHALQELRNAASFAETLALSMGCRFIDGEYLLAGTSRPSASAIVWTWYGLALQQMLTYFISRVRVWSANCAISKCVHPKGSSARGKAC